MRPHRYKFVYPPDCAVRGHSCPFTGGRIPRTAVRGHSCPFTGGRIPRTALCAVTAVHSPGAVSPGPPGSLALLKNYETVYVKYDPHLQVKKEIDIRQSPFCALNQLPIETGSGETASRAQNLPFCSRDFWSVRKSDHFAHDRLPKQHPVRKTRFFAHGIFSVCAKGALLLTEFYTNVL